MNKFVCEKKKKLTRANIILEESVKSWAELLHKNKKVNTYKYICTKYAWGGVNDHLLTLFYCANFTVFTVYEDDDMRAFLDNVATRNKQICHVLLFAVYNNSLFVFMSCIFFFCVFVFHLDCTRSYIRFTTTTIITKKKMRNLKCLEDITSFFETPEQIRYFW